MSRFRKSKHDDEYNFWQPATDLMTGLVFILMLLVALLGLYLLYTPSLYDAMEPTTEALVDEEEGDTFESETYEWVDEEEGDGDGDGEYEEHDNSDGYGNGYNSINDGFKSAVLAELVDGETGRIVRAEEAEFELYGDNGAIQILHTYYPEKISYRKFMTTEEGIFYLPEKIWLGNYYFHELTAPAGYDLAESQYFELTEIHDWSNPYLVRIPIFPSKNVIRVQMNDKESGLSVGGAVFQVIAAEDIRTLDGTLRFSSGQTVAQIVCDENGYGESEALYLGNYILKQEKAPAYYAAAIEAVEASVEKKTNVDSELHEIDAEKTQIRITLSDELYPDRMLSDAEFLVRKEGISSFAETVYTDSSGAVTLTNLEKDTVYHIIQKTAPEDYRLDETEYIAAVTADGRIDGHSVLELGLTNRMLRVNIKAVDAVLRSGTPDVTLEIYNSENELLHSWQTNGSGLLFTNLKEGSYYIVKNGNTKKPYEFHVTDTKEIQNAVIPVITWLGAAIAAAAVLGLIILGVLFVFLVKMLVKHRKKKTGEKASKG